MLLGFLALAASAFLGAVVLIAGLALLVTRTWRRAGGLVLCAGALGAVLGVLALLAVRLLLAPTPPAGLEAWLLFGAAGFGLAGFFALAAFTVVFLFGRPTRWADRRRGAHA